MDAPTNADRDRRAADLRERAELVREHGWSGYVNIWSSGEVLGVRAVLGEPGALDAACPIWAPTLWGAAWTEAHTARSHSRTRQWFAALQGERITISAAAMHELRPRMQELLAAGWTLVRMDKPLAEGHGDPVVAWFERAGDESGTDPLEMTPEEKGSLAASNAALRDLAGALLSRDRDGADAAFAAVHQVEAQVDREALLDKIHMPDDAGEYEDGLRAIMMRIPDGWGRWISCSRGWYPIIIELDQQLAAIDPDYGIHQLKEKLAMLRAYIRASDGVSEADQQQMRDLVREAEAQAETTCELCGEPGVRQVSPRGWLKTLCAACAEQKGYERLGELVNDLTPDHRGLWRVTDYAGTESHWDMSHGEVSIVGGDHHRGVEVLALPSVLRTWRIRLVDGTEVQSELIAAIERVR